MSLLILNDLGIGGKAPKQRVADKNPGSQSDLAAVSQAGRQKSAFSTYRCGGALVYISGREDGGTVAP